MSRTEFESETQVGDDSEASHSPSGAAAPGVPHPQPGSWSEVDPGHYDVGAELSSGGLGRVFVAQDCRLQRRVAIKQLRVRGRRVDERFRREAQITARLQHPSIVPIYEAGRWPNGEPFYAMKLVSGRTLDELIRDSPDLASRLALLPIAIKAAEAVAYAHSRRVIHRDLKPLNIMAGAFGEALVIDWGLAKELDAEADEGSNPDPAEHEAGEPADGWALTRAGAILGTPSFMAPEQARGEPADPRSDVYALGSVLYCLLCGTEPFRGTPQEITEAASSRPPPPVSEREPEAPRELVAIVEKAMARDPAQRYPDAGALVEDLRLFETGQLVQAHRYSAAALFRRWVALHRAAVALALGALLGLAGIQVTAVVSARRTVRERDAAERARAVAEHRGSELLLTQAKLLVEKRPTDAIAALKQYAAGVRPDWRAVESLVAEARSRVLSRHVFSGLDRPAVSDDGRLAVWVEGEAIRAIDLEQNAARSFPLPGGGALLALGRVSLLAWSRTGEVVSLDLERGHRCALGSLAAAPIAAAMTADERQFAVASAGGAVSLLGCGLPARALATHEGAVKKLRFSPDAAWLFSSGLDGTARAIRTSGGQWKAALGGAVLHDSAFSPDSRLVALSSSDADVRVLDMARGEERRLLGHQESTAGIAFSPDAKKLYSGSADETLREWDLATGRSRVLARHDGIIEKLAVSPSGRFLATASANQTVRVWDLSLGESTTLNGHDDYVHSMVFSADERRLVTADGSGQVRVWDLPPPPRLLPTSGTVEELSSASDGALFAESAGEIRIFSAQDGAVRSSLTARGLQRPIAVGPGGSIFAAAGEGGAVLVWRRGESSPRVLSGSVGRIDALAISSDGRWLASSGDDRLVRVWDLESGSIARRLEGHLAPVRVLAFSPDAKLLASAGDDDELRVWTLETGEVRQYPSADRVYRYTISAREAGFRFLAPAGDDELRSGRQANGEVRRYPSADLAYSLGFSLDGQLLAWTGGRSAASLLRVSTGEFASLEGHSAAIRPIAVSPDGLNVAAGAEDRTTRIWTLPALTSVALADDAAVRLVQFSPDGRQLLTATERTARLWDVGRAAQTFCIRGARNIKSAVLTGDGRWLAVAFDADRFVRVWPTAGDGGVLTQGWLEQLSTARFDADGRVTSPVPP